MCYAGPFLLDFSSALSLIVREKNENPYPTLAIISDSDMLYPPDAGTFSPYEHGEVYVLDDGGEVDLDLGNYERFLNVSLSRDNNITTGAGRELHIDTHRQTDTKTGRETHVH